MQAEKERNRLRNLPNKVVVQAGDSWFEIAGRVFAPMFGGDEVAAQRYAAALAAANPNVKTLTAGMVLRIPRFGGTNPYISQGAMNAWSGQTAPAPAAAPTAPATAPQYSASPETRDATRQPPIQVTPQAYQPWQPSLAGQTSSSVAGNPYQGYQPWQPNPIPPYQPPRPAQQGATPRPSAPRPLPEQRDPTRQPRPPAPAPQPVPYVDRLTPNFKATEALRLPANQVFDTDRVAQMIQNNQRPKYVGPNSAYKIIPREPGEEWEEYVVRLNTTMIQAGYNLNQYGYWEDSGAAAQGAGTPSGNNPYFGQGGTYRGGPGGFRGGGGGGGGGGRAGMLFGGDVDRGGRRNTPSGRNILDAGMGLVTWRL